MKPGYEVRDNKIYLRGVGGAPVGEYHPVNTEVAAWLTVGMVVALIILFILWGFKPS